MIQHSDATGGMGRAAFRGAVFCLAVVLAGLLAFLGSDIAGAKAKQTVSIAMFVVAALVAAVSCGLAARREQGRQRRAWALLCATATCSTLGHLVWLYYQLIAGKQPFPGLNDAFYIAALCLAAAGMLSFPASAKRATGRARAILDCVMVASALLVVSWVLLLGPVFATTGLGALARAVSITYPLADIAIVTLALLLASRAQARNRLPLVMAAAALVSCGLADSAFAYQAAKGAFALGTPLDMGWVAGYLMLALSAAAPTTSDRGVRKPRLTFVTAALPYLPVVVAVVVVTATQVSLADDPVLAAAGLVLLLTFAARQSLTMAENYRLNRDLETQVALRTAALEQLNRRTQSILESAGEGIYGVDGEGCATFANPSALALTGYTADELMGRRLHDLIHHSSQRETPRPWDECRLQAALRDGSTVHETDEVYWRKDGSSFPVEDTVTPMRDEHGLVTGAVVVFRDITQRRAIEHMKDEFISVVSHELRTPLTSIRGALGLLAGGALGELPVKGQRMLDIAVENTDRLVRLINDILDIERMTSGKMVLHNEVCDATELVARLVEFMGPVAESAGVELVVDARKARLWADPDRVVQTLTNLVGNAIKFSSAGSAIELGVTPRGDDVLFTVADEGRGIPDDQLETVFGRFHQVDASDARQKGGTGLGLAISRSIVEQHGGRIWAQNDPEGGARFQFTLPVLSTAEAVPDRPALGDGPSVLVCDDDETVLQVLEALLETHGYRPLLASSGDQAVRMAQEARPAAVVLDLVMPGASGWDTAARLKESEETRDIPIVILSVLPPELGDGLEAVVTDWVSKPAEEMALLRAVRGAVDGGGGTPRVLVVENDPDLASVLQSMFEARGLQTVRAATGRAAVEASQTARPDLLVLDLGLPDGDGFAVVDWMREHDRLRQVPLVVYTARDLNQADRERLALGETSYFTKGRVSPEDFERHVMDLLGRITAPAKLAVGTGDG